MTDAPKRITVDWDEKPRSSKIGTAWESDLGDHEYILAIPEALAASPEVQALILEAEARASADANARVEGLLEHGTTILQAAKELAEYASYAEIVGGVSVNRPQVREWCDKVFSAIHALPKDENFERSFAALAKHSTGDAK